LAVDSAAEVFALRVIITRIALELSEAQNDVTPIGWMEGIARECAHAVSNLQIESLSGIESELFREATVDKIFEILTGTAKTRTRDLPA